eukprot:scaffold3050_cov362-Prasinococcus_capsulatus_cf.AAC.1
MDTLAANVTCYDGDHLYQGPLGDHCYECTEHSHCGPSQYCGQPYSDDYECVDCHYSCASCSGGGAGSCTTCFDGDHLYNGLLGDYCYECTQNSHCGASQYCDQPYYDDYKCEDCHYSCQTCNGSGAGSCTSCGLGRHLYQSFLGWTYCYECEEDEHCPQGFECSTDVANTWEFHCTESGDAPLFTEDVTIITRWNPASFSGNIELTLFESDLVSDDECFTIVTDAPNAGEYAWTLPEGFWTYDCVGNIADHGLNPSVRDDLAFYVKATGMVGDNVAQERYLKGFRIILPSLPSPKPPPSPPPPPSPAP